MSERAGAIAPDRMKFLVGTPDSPLRAVSRSAACFSFEVNLAKAIASGLLKGRPDSPPHEGVEVRSSFLLGINMPDFANFITHPIHL